MHLEADSVLIGLAALGTVGADELLRCANPADRSYSDQHSRPLRRRQSLLGRALLRSIAAAELGGEESDVAIRCDQRGKPWVSDGSGRILPASVSHSRDCVACAVSPAGLLGIDVEYCDPRRDIRGMGSFIAGAQGDDLDLPGFYRLWTMHEAHGKATGRGLRFPAPSSLLRAATSTERALAITLEGVVCRFRSVELKGYALAVCLAEPGSDPRSPETG